MVKCERGGQSGQLRAIDVGAGLGVETHYLLKKGWYVTAIEPNKFLANQIYLNHPNSSSRLAIINDKIENINIGSFDLMYAGYSLQYIDKKNIQDVICKFHKSLTPNGFFIAQFFGPLNQLSTHENTATYDSIEISSLFKTNWIVHECDEYKGFGSRHPDQFWHFNTVIAQPL